MKFKTLGLLTTLLVFNISSCYLSEPNPESDYKPVLMTRSALESSVKLEAPREIENYGKIYIKGDLLFINEKFEGIHIIDNSNPSNPASLGFINIPGNVDISIKGNIIYADNAVDLIAIKYENDQITVVDRNENVFPEFLPPDGRLLANEYSEENRPKNSVIVKWTQR